MTTVQAMPFASTIFIADGPCVHRDNPRAAVIYDGTKATYFDLEKRVDLYAAEAKKYVLICLQAKTVASWLLKFNVRHTEYRCLVSMAEVLHMGKYSGFEAFEVEFSFHQGYIKSMLALQKSITYNGIRSEDTEETLIEHCTWMYNQFLNWQIPDWAQMPIRIENRMAFALGSIEFNGFPIDIDRWKTLNRRLNFERDYHYYELSNTIRNMFSEEVLEPYCNSLNYIDLDKAEVALAIMKMAGVRTYGTHNHKNTLSEEILGTSKVPLAHSYLKYVKAKKKASDFSEKWIEFAHGSRIYTKFKHMVSTGRMSCGATKLGPFPNLHGINKYDSRIRSCFRTSPSRVLVYCDYVAQEPFILAFQANEKKLIDFFTSKAKDIHSYVARLCYPEELHDKSLTEIKEQYPLHRKKAKETLFTITYGGTTSTMASKLNISLKEAETIYQNFMRAFPDLEAYLNQIGNAAVENRYIVLNSKTQRRRFMPSKSRSNSDKAVFRKAVNSPVQGTAADMTKIAVIMFLDSAAHLDVKLVNIIADEIVVETTEENADAVREILLDSMAMACKILLDNNQIGITAKVSAAWS